MSLAKFQPADILCPKKIALWGSEAKDLVMTFYWGDLPRA